MRFIVGVVLFSLLMVACIIAGWATWRCANVPYSVEPCEGCDKGWAKRPSSLCTRCARREVTTYKRRA